MKKSNKHPLRENYERYFGGLGTGFKNDRKNETVNEDLNDSLIQAEFRDALDGIEEVLEKIRSTQPGIPNQATIDELGYALEDALNFLKDYELFEY